jgi:hypothetical protein
LSRAELQAQVAKVSDYSEPQNNCCPVLHVSRVDTRARSRRRFSCMPLTRGPVGVVVSIVSLGSSNQC